MLKVNRKINSTHKYSEAEIKTMLEFLHLCSYWWSSISTVCWNSHGYELCPFVSGTIFILIWKTFTRDEKKSLLGHLIWHLEISTQFYLLTMINFIHPAIMSLMYSSILRRIWFHFTAFYLGFCLVLIVITFRISKFFSLIINEET
jgi:hypothetical protein